MNVLSESEGRTRSGIAWLVADVMLFLAAIGLFVTGLIAEFGPLVIVSVVVLLAVVVMSVSFFMVQPNQAAVLTLFGDYRGSDRTAGLRVANPFYINRKVSLRARVKPWDFSRACA